MSVEQRILQFIQLAAIFIVAVICYQVIEPFIPSMLFAVAVCTSTWPLYLRLRKLLWEKSAAAAVLMVLMLVVLVIGPSALLAVNLASSVKALADAATAIQSHGPVQPPPWLKDTPVIGGQLDSYWHELSLGGEEALALLRELLQPAVTFLLSAGKAIGGSLLQMLLAAFIGFFFYRDGEALLHYLRRALTKLAGEPGEKLLASIHHTVASVVQGMFGAALAQAIVAVIGFRIAGVPGAFLLGAATFFLAMLPIGPPLVWGGATVWLVYQGTWGWAVFIFLWGLLGISSIDNVVKPYLISRGSKLSFLLIVMGVFGGVFAFGFIGIFIGPPILALGLAMVRLWTTLPVPERRNQPIPPEQRGTIDHTP